MDSNKKSILIKQRNDEIYYKNLKLLINLSPFELFTYSDLVFFVCSGSNNKKRMMNIINRLIEENILRKINKCIYTYYMKNEVNL